MEWAPEAEQFQAANLTGFRGCSSSKRLGPTRRTGPLGVLSKMFSLAEVWGWRPDGSNPCRHVKRYKERKRKRFLSPEETERLGEVLRKAKDECRPRSPPSTYPC